MAPLNCLLAACSLLGTALAAGVVPPAMTVTVQLHSGVQNPSFHVPADAVLLKLIDCVGPRLPRPLRFGYRGFALEIPNGDNPAISKLVYANEEAELALLDAAVAAGVVNRHAADYVREEVARVKAEDDWQPPEDQPPSRRMTEEDVSAEDAPCSAPARGVDRPTEVGSERGAPIYDPAPRDACGFFVSRQPLNNCYNYATNIATDSFAQPGRGSNHPIESISCQTLRAGAESDGLVWQGDTLPPAVPSKGHYVALFVAASDDFLWLRRNRGGAWSHKPGGLQVRDMDRQGNPITDVREANLYPYTNFCGYFWVQPSIVCPGPDKCIQ